MNTLSKSLICGFAAISLACWTPQANAVPLAPGATIAPAAEVDPVGGVVVGSLVSPYIAGAAPNIFSGVITTTVISGGVNPLGGLTFTYLFSSDASSATSVGRLTVEGFAGFLLDASYQVPGPLGVIPTYINRTPGAGDVVGYYFIGAPAGAGMVSAGTASVLLVIQTSATAFRTSQANLIDGAVATTSILAPAIPDGGTTAVLLGFALLGIAGWSRKFAAVQ